MRSYVVLAMTHTRTLLVAVLLQMEEQSPHLPIEIGSWRDVSKGQFVAPCALAARTAHIVERMS